MKPATQLPNFPNQVIFWAILNFRMSLQGPHNPEPFLSGRHFPGGNVHVTKIDRLKMYCEAKCFQPKKKMCDETLVRVIIIGMKYDWNEIHFLQITIWFLVCLLIYKLQYVLHRKEQIIVQDHFGMTAGYRLESLFSRQWLFVPRTSLLWPSVPRRQILSLPAYHDLHHIDFWDPTGRRNMNT